MIRAGDGVVAAVGVEARDVESEPLRARPQVRILEPALVGEQRLVHLPEGALPARRLGRAGRRERARMGAADGEVAEHDAQRQVAQAQLEGGAERALVVAVDDHQRPGVRAADVLPGPDGRERRGGQIAHGLRLLGRASDVSDPGVLVVRLM